jgi:hypothetical protein
LFNDTETAAPGFGQFPFAAYFRVKSPYVAPQSQPRGASPWPLTKGSLVSGIARSPGVIHRGSCFFVAQGSGEVWRNNVRNSCSAKLVMDVLGTATGKPVPFTPCVVYLAKETTMKLPVKTIGAVLLTASLASVSLAKPAEARWLGWRWGGLGFGLAAGALLGAAATSAYGYGYGYGYGYPAYSYGYVYPAYSYGYGYPAYYGYSYPAYRVGYAYPSYGYYPRRAYRAYAFAPVRLRRHWVRY